MPNVATSIQNLIHCLQMLQGCKHLLDVYVTLGINSSKYISSQSIAFFLLLQNLFEAILDSEFISL